MTYYYEVLEGFVKAQAKAEANFINEFIAGMVDTEFNKIPIMTLHPIGKQAIHAVAIQFSYPNRDDVYFIAGYVFRIKVEE